MQHLRLKFFRIVDVLLTPAVLILAPLAAALARLRCRAPLSRSILEKFQVTVVRHHYYEPVVFPRDLTRDIRLPRQIVGLDMNEPGQLSLLEKFKYRDELLAIPIQKTAPSKFDYHNGFFESGDAEFLYNIIRYFKPRRIIEVGSGNSTLMGRLAIEENAKENREYPIPKTLICLAGLHFRPTFPCLIPSALAKKELAIKNGLFKLI